MTDHERENMARDNPALLKHLDSWPDIEAAGHRETVVSHFLVYCAGLFSGITGTLLGLWAGGVL